MSKQFCVSEVEARQKWCPFAQTAFSWSERPVLLGNQIGEPQVVAVSANRAPGMADPCNCLGSDCMAWRWVETHVQGPMKDDGSLGDMVASGDTHGVCGLAGPPSHF